MTTMREGVKRLYADVGDRQMHARIARPRADSGRPPVICFHMSPMSGRIYEAVLQDLGRDRLALAPDTPGFGHSDRPDTMPSLQDYADSMMGLLDALDIGGPVDLFGYHTGSRVALLLANRYPERVRRVMTVSMSIRTPEELQASRDHYKPTPPTEDGSHLAKIWRGFVYWEMHGGSTLEQAADAFSCRLLGGSHDWWGHRAAFDFAPEDWLPKTKQPLVILNTGDDLTEYTKRAHDFLAENGRVLDVPRWGHSFLALHTADAVRLMRSFYDAPDDDPFGALNPGSGAA